MNLLLDTHVLLWWLADDDALTDVERVAIAHPDNVIFVRACMRRRKHEKMWGAHEK